MRDVSHKVSTKRVALARAELKASPETMRAIREGKVPKGDPLPVAKVAAVMAAKRTTEWIPYCHNIPIEFVDVRFEVHEAGINVEVEVVSIAKTGVEMEALTAASAAVLNLYDMLKAIDEEMEIGSVRLMKKTGGKSDFPAPNGWTSAVLVVSDRVSRGESKDVSGAILAAGLAELGGQVPGPTVVPDDVHAIQEAVTQWVAQGVDFILITGGTGVGPRDITPDSLSSIIDKPLPGIAETFRSYSQERARTALLSRSVAGLAGKSVIISLPGSPAACKDALNALFPAVLHAKEMIAGGGH
ncbi:MAG: bifunctional molybdenum cofactor biosynthesis protein MoaC/MoaB [Armatimonadetes bacterium]|nr:bifunctional molybdenum cofactor biosynthesis protein MoaC/MoaB [Armatimonadota bacterium]